MDPGLSERGGIIGGSRGEYCISEARDSPPGAMEFIVLKSHIMQDWNDYRQNL